MILSIESSCDDSSIAITELKSKKILFHKKISQESSHACYGGVVPELAARLHAKALPDILKQTKEFLPHIKAVAVTNEPGLSVTLVEGVTMAKALSIALRVPILPINHLKGHVYSLFLEQDERLPMGILLVSGGHTQVLHVKAYNDIEILATSLDDSFGESFDKVSKMLGYGYPGGVVVENLAKKGDEDRFNFTVPLSNSPKLAFSYSGLKNQVRLEIAKLSSEISEQDKCDICASFQKVAIKHLIQKIKKLLKLHRFEHFGIVGGASANIYLKNEFAKLFSNVQTPPLKYCSDNAAMIGRAALRAYELGEFCSFEAIDVRAKSSF